MFLEQKPHQENHDNNNGLMRASVYDYQSMENIPSYYRELMKVENNSMSYIDSICDQLKTHLNIVASSKDCIDLVCNEIERNEIFYNSSKATEAMQSLKNNDDDLVWIKTVLVPSASSAFHTVISSRRILLCACVNFLFRNFRLYVIFSMPMFYATVEKYLRLHSPSMQKVYYIIFIEHSMTKDKF